MRRRAHALAMLNNDATPLCAHPTGYEMNWNDCLQFRRFGHMCPDGRSPHTRPGYGRTSLVQCENFQDRQLS
jgi:hypothetical protein